MTYEELQDWAYGRHPAYDAKGNFLPAEKLVEIIDTLLAEIRRLNRK